MHTEYMSIREGLLALLASEPKYGYQLKSEFEEHTGGVWPLNVGQVYTTLDRLQRDELVLPGTADAEGRTSYAITKAGRKELNAWFTSAHDTAPPRDELMIKVLLAMVTPDVDAADVIDAQRAGLMSVLRTHRRRLQQLEAAPALDDLDDARDHLTATLLFDALVARVEAELRWLDICDERLRTSQKLSQKGKRS
jgi:DNA-binding PadR family transcriptional regulator